jgi:hypothetical protein
MQEELTMNKVRDVPKLCAMADKCAHAEEGRILPGEDAGTEVDSEDDDGGTAPKKKGRKHNRKNKSKAVLAVEGSSNDDTTKKAKTGVSSKEVVGCTSCQALVAADLTEGSGKQYCKIHLTQEP